MLTGFVYFVDGARLLQYEARVCIQAHLGALLDTS